MLNRLRKIGKAIEAGVRSERFGRDAKITVTHQNNGGASRAPGGVIVLVIANSRLAKRSEIAQGREWRWQTALAYPAPVMPRSAHFAKTERLDRFVTDVRDRLFNRIRRMD